MKLLFCRRNTIASWAIRFATWSRWSHCAIVDGKSVIESTAWHGVRARPLADFLADYHGIEPVEVACPDEEAGLRWARAQVGLPYDWTAIVGFVLRRDWSEPDSWFCSEFAEGTLRAAGRDRFRAAVARITPQHVWMVRD